MQIVLSTNNPFKQKEIITQLGNRFEILPLKEIAGDVDIPETGQTLEENALIKANYIYNNYGMNCIADDTGLEVEALNGGPGVYSARYAGEHCSFEENLHKLLSELETETNRKARFRTVIALILNGKKYLFEGIVNGQILKEKRGIKGFGYDPVFLPDGYKKTFAEMDIDEKNTISHRGKAVRKLVEFLGN